MLSLRLTRFTIRSGRLYPKFLTPKHSLAFADAEDLIALVKQSEGDRLKELTEAFEASFAGHPDILLMRGMLKLLLDRVDNESQELLSFHESPQKVSPEKIRRVVFDLAARQHPLRPLGGGGFHEREAILAEASALLKLSSEQIEEGLYGDLAEEQRIGALPLVSAEELVDRYNMALAQSFLLRARQLDIKILDSSPQRLKALVRALKFRRLLFRIHQEPSEDGKKPPIHLQLDGPLSLFRHTSRYGMALAQFLPELSRSSKWELEGRIEWGKKKRELSYLLSHRSPLRTHQKDRGTWTTREEQHLQAQFERLEGPWRLLDSHALFDLQGQDILSPSYVLQHEDGRKAYLELVFSWTKASFIKRLERIEASAPSNLILAYAEKGGLDEEQALPRLQGKALYAFKGVISTKKLIELAKKVAL